MATYGVAEAKNKFTHLLERVEAGENITITRHGRAIVEMTAVSRTARRPDVEQRRASLRDLAKWRDQQPPLGDSAAALVRQMRDDGL